MNVALLLALLAAAPLQRREADPQRWYAGDVLYAVAPGDLKSLASRLDVLAELGVSGLVLPQIFASPDGLAAADWDRVDPRFGDNAAAGALFSAAHGRGLSVLLTFVPNHVSSSHVWFRSAESGDRLAQDRFVFADQKPEGWTSPSIADADPWSKSEGANRWYYHAFAASMPDLDLRDRPTRAMVGRAAESWIERGVDGLLLESIRYLIEDGRGKQVDRPETLAIVRELAAMGAKHRALVVGFADSDLSVAATYLDPLPLVVDVDRAAAIDRALERGSAAELEIVLQKSERLAPSSAAFAPFSRTPGAPPIGVKYGPDAQVLSNVLLLASGGVPLLQHGDELGIEAFSWEDVEKQRADPKSVFSRTRALLGLRKDSAALRTGLRFPVSAKGGPGLFAFLRYDGRDRVLVLVNVAAAPVNATLDLRGLPLPASATWKAIFGPPQEMAKNKAFVPARGAAMFRLAEETPNFVVRFGAPGMLAPSGGAIAIDRGLIFEERRGMGFSRDAVDRLLCTRDKKDRLDRCSVTFTRRSRFEETHLRWQAALPPGPYRVEVSPADPRTRLGDRSLEAEGEPLLAKGKTLVRNVFVRDGLLTLAAAPEDRGATPIAVAEIKVAPAPFRSEKIAAEVLADRVVLKAPGPGVVEWRMNNASTEPVEQAPLIKKGALWEATLGPWPKGAVNEIAYVIRSEKGPFVTAERGVEFVTRIE